MSSVDDSACAMTAYVPLRQALAMTSKSRFGLIFISSAPRRFNPQFTRNFRFRRTATDSTFRARLHRLPTGWSLVEFSTLDLMLTRRDPSSTGSHGVTVGPTGIDQIKSAAFQ